MNMHSALISRSSLWKNSTLFAVLLGFIGYLTLVGYRALYPTNIAWLNISDPSTYYLGWEFFRFSDWSFPLGLNPQYGIELSNSILYSDSNPLFAILFKAFSSVLPVPFQYFGLWLLVCFLMQAYFAERLMSLATHDMFFRLIGVAFFIFAPILNWRLHEKIGHLTISGHFFLLGALYLTLKEVTSTRKNLIAWLFLLITAASVNSYLLMMTSLFWLTNLSKVNYWNKNECMFTISAVLGTFCSVLFVCWQVGYFSVSGDGLYIISDYFNYFRMNVLGIIDPGIPDYGLWSYILPDVPGDNHQHEGFNFLGFGFLLLIPFALRPAFHWLKLSNNQLTSNWLFIVVLLGLVFISLSHKIGIGAWNYQLNVNESLLKVLNIFRGHGRMFWPVFYFIYWAVLVLIVIGYPRRIAAFILGLSLCIQIVDTSRGWIPIRNFLMMSPASSWYSPLSDPFWEGAGKKYKKLYRVPGGNAIPHWVTFAAYAGKYRMATDSVYLGRVSPEAVAIANKKSMDAITSGKYEVDALYILDQGVLPIALPNLNQLRDKLIYANGFYVVAPNWIDNESIEK